MHPSSLISSSLLVVVLAGAALAGCLGSSPAVDPCEALTWSIEVNEQATNLTRRATVNATLSNVGDHPVDVLAPLLDVDYGFWLEDLASGQRVAPGSGGEEGVGDIPAPTEDDVERLGPGGVVKRTIVSDGHWAYKSSLYSEGHRYALGVTYSPPQELPGIESAYCHVRLEASETVRALEHGRVEVVEH